MGRRFLERCGHETTFRDGGSDLKDPESADRCPAHLALLVHSGIDEAMAALSAGELDIGGPDQYRRQ